MIAFFLKLGAWCTAKTCTCILCFSTLKVGMHVEIFHFFLTSPAPYGGHTLVWSYQALLESAAGRFGNSI